MNETVQMRRDLEKTKKQLALVNADLLRVTDFLQAEMSDSRKCPDCLYSSTFRYRRVDYCLYHRRLNDLLGMLG